MGRPLTLITGASSGIGETVALRLASERNLILHGRDEHRLSELHRRLPEPERHVLWVRDLSHPIDASLDDLVNATGEHVSEFVHAAGAFGICPVRKAHYRECVDLFQANFFSAAAIARALVQRVNRRGLRSVVFISSVASRYGARGYAPYAATKGALEALARSLACELAPAVRVNSVAPGPIRTPGTEFLYSDGTLRERIEAASLLGQGTAADVAGVVAFLLSPEARWITGQTLFVDGGRSAH